MKRALAAASALAAFAVVAAGLVTVPATRVRAAAQAPHPIAPSPNGCALPQCTRRPPRRRTTPPDIIAPQFAWRDNNPAATGEKLQISELDTTPKGYVPPTFTPEEQQMHTWRPDDRTWPEIKKLSVNRRTSPQQHGRRPGGYGQDRRGHRRVAARR